MFVVAILGHLVSRGSQVGFNFPHGAWLPDPGLFRIQNPILMIRRARHRRLQPLSVVLAVLVFIRLLLLLLLLLAQVDHNELSLVDSCVHWAVA